MLNFGDHTRSNVKWPLEVYHKDANAIITRLQKAFSVCISSGLNALIQVNLN